MRIFNFLLAFTLSFTALAQKTATLRLTPDVGDVFTVTVDQHQEISQTVMGMEQEIVQNQAIRMVYECTGVSKNEISMDATIDGVKLSTSGAVGEMNYDSDNPSDEATGQALVYSAMIGSVLETKFNAYGQIESMIGVDAMMEKVADAFDFNEGPEREAFMTEVSKSISDESFARDFGASMIAFPKGGLSVGDTWAQESTVKAQTSLELVTTYTVEEITDDEVVLSLVGELKTPDSDSEPVEVNGMEMIYTLSGTQSGTVRIDRETGWVTTSTMQQDVSGEVEMLPNAQLPEGLTWPLELKAIIKMTTE